MAKTMDELLKEFITLSDEIDDAIKGVEIPDLSSSKAELVAQIMSKIESYLKVSHTMDQRVKELDEEIARLSERRNRAAEKSEEILNAVKSAMLITGKSKIETTFHTARIKKTPGKIVILDETAVPEDFITFSAPKPPAPRIDKKTVKSFLQEHPEGVEWACFEEGWSLKIE